MNFLFAIFIVGLTHMSEKIPQDSISKTEHQIQELKNEIEALEKKLDKSQGHLEELRNTESKRVGEAIDHAIKESRLMYEKSDQRLNIYLGVGGGVLLFAGFFFNFFGRRVIREFMNRELQKALDKEVKTRLDESLTEDWLKSQVEDRAQKPISRAIDLLEKNFKRVSEEMIEEEKGKHDKQRKEAKERLQIQLETLRGELEKVKIAENSENLSKEEKEKVIEFEETLQESKTESEFTANDWYWKGKAEFDREEYENSIRSYSKTLELEANDAKAWNNRGLAKSRLNLLDDALKDYEKATELDPDSSIFWFNMGALKTKLDRVEESIQHYNKSLELDPKMEYSWNNRGYSKILLGQYSQAIEDLNESIKLGGLPNAYAHRAYANLMLDKLDSALEDTEIAIKFDPDYARPYFNLGLIRQKQGKTGEACNAWKKALKLGFEEAQEKLDEFCTDSPK